MSPFYKKPKVSKLSVYTRNAIINVGLIQLPFLYVLQYILPASLLPPFLTQHILGSAQGWI